jgi:small conductance mechanosensitive channel
MNKAEEAFSFSTQWITENTLSVVTALLVFLAGWYLSGLLSRQIVHLIRRAPNMDHTVAPIVGELFRYAIIAITIVMVLGQFGVQTASILAVLGAIGLAIALALQGTLSNMAAGIMLLWLRPFNIGESIDAEGTAGTILEVGLFATRLKTYDGIFVFAPNSKLWNARITNYSRQPTRMIETPVGIAYHASIEKARIALLGIARDAKTMDDPAPSVFVASLGDSSVNLVLRVWVKKADWWETKTMLTERSKTALDAAGIEIPFNKLDVNVLSLPRDGAKPPAPATDRRDPA